MRFPTTLLSSLIVLIGALIYAYFALFSIGESDRKEYWVLMAQTDPHLSQTPYTAKQHHHRVHKDIWFTKAGQRMQVRIYSADTELVLDRQDQQTEVVEKMHGVTCYMQEELYFVLPDGREVIKLEDGTLKLRGSDPQKTGSLATIEQTELKPLQIIRYLEADTASYYYQTDRFLADDVKVSRFITEGHTLVESLDGLKPLMDGIASSVEFSLVGDDLLFTAQQLKATIRTTGRPL